MSPLQPIVLTRLFVLLAMFWAAPAAADCVYPKAPATLPQGSTATYEQMREAHRAVSEFDAEVHGFTVCLGLQAQEIRVGGNLAAEELASALAQLTEIHNAAVAEAEFVAEQFNQQLRIYRERAPTSE
jgi:hypothetical protein